MEEKRMLPVGERQKDLDERVARIESEEPGKQVTFVISVLFRQNVTRQGTVRWLDRDRTQNFRSTLELIPLMEDALSHDGGAPTAPDRWRESAKMKTGDIGRF